MLRKAARRSSDPLLSHIRSSDKIAFTTSSTRPVLFSPQREAATVFFFFFFKPFLECARTPGSPVQATMTNCFGFSLSSVRRKQGAVFLRSPLLLANKAFKIYFFSRKGSRE
jgi:hypothetical protein